MNDEELKDQLRRSDPAAGQPPLPPSDVLRLLNQTTKDRHRRSVWKPMAASVLVAAASVGVFAGLNPKEDPVAPAPVVARANAESDALAKCPPPTADELQESQMAFEATAQKIEDGLVRLSVTRTFVGTPADELEVAQTSGATEVLLGGTSFEVGTTYLVAIENGTVKGCGYSGVASDQLRELYEEAF